MVSDTGLLTGRPKRQFVSAVAAFCFDRSASVDVRRKQTDFFFPLSPPPSVEYERQTPSQIVTLHSRHPPDRFVVFHLTHNDFHAHADAQTAAKGALAYFRVDEASEASSRLSSLQVGSSEA